MIEELFKVEGQSNKLGEIEEEGDTAGIDRCTNGREASRSDREQRDGVKFYCSKDGEGVKRKQFRVPTFVVNCSLDDVQTILQQYRVKDIQYVKLNLINIVKLKPALLPRPMDKH